MARVPRTDVVSWMASCLYVWNQPELFKDKWPLATRLITACYEDARSPVDPSCWAALCDLIEEAGEVTLMRQYVCMYWTEIAE